MTQAGWSLAIHGGAGTLSRDTISPDEEALVRAVLTAARGAGAAILAAGGSALDAVEAAVLMLEDDPQFNAGRGSTVTYEGHFELDAAVMDGSDPRGRGGCRGAHGEKSSHAWRARSWRKARTRSSPGPGRRNSPGSTASSRPP